MKNVIIVLVLIFTGQNVIGQYEQRNWIFGRTHAVNPTNFNLDFFPDGVSLYPPAPIPPPMGSPPTGIGPANGFESWCVITDQVTGDLQFYTDGRFVYNNSHTDITPPGGLGASPSSAQPVAACVVPICPFDKYYIFSNPTGKETGVGTTTGPITYRVYDSDLGTFSVSSNLPGPFSATAVGEGMLIIPGNDPLEFFLITRLLLPIGPAGLGGDSRYVVYKIDASGLSYHADFDFGPGVGTDGTGASVIMNMTYSKNRFPSPVLGEVAFTASRDGLGTDNFVFTCQFNNATGFFNTGTEIIVNQFGGAPGGDILYDCEYSPDGNFLYYANYFNSNLFQYEFLTGDTYQVGGFGNRRGGGLKLGPDGFIYHIQNAGSTSNLGTVVIGRITSPNTELLANFPGPPSPIYDNVNLLTSPNTFAYNFPEFLTTPLWSATVEIMGNDSICPGETTTLTAEIDALGMPIEGYTWQFSSDGGVTWTDLIGGGTSIDVSEPGVYRLIVNLSDDCEITSLSVEIFERENCCFITEESDALVYSLSMSINEDLAWDNKVYIADNVILTIDNGAILDITNVDVIFGECAGIDFVGGATLRSNNSVYRPCTYNGVWRGLNFHNNSTINENSTGIINECVFKNAQRAIHIFDQSVTDIRITNNLFSNCKASVDINNTAFTRSITGNTFLIDDLAPEFSGYICSWGGFASTFYGIRSNGVQFREVIAQNDFIAPDFTPVDYRGIELDNCSESVITENKFTDVYRGIQLNMCANNRIESNEINLGDKLFGYVHQIAIFNSRNTLIKENELNSTKEEPWPVWSGTNSAIYCEIGDTYSIKNNQITGFETGIQLEGILSSYATENQIDNCRFYGIYMNDAFQVKTQCNTIDMDAQAGTNVIGIANYQTIAGDRDNLIASNCIFETNTAIYLQAPVGAPISTIPEIKNNFLYNYSVTGVRNLNFSGDIGSSPSPSAGAGRNTFVTNNGAAGAIDILTNPNPLISFGNFGVNSISGPVTVTGNTINSTANCGAHIDLPNSDNGYMEICDALSHGAGNLISSDNELNGDYKSHLNDQSLEIIQYALNQFYMNANLADFEELYAATVNDYNFINEELKWLKVQYHQIKGEFDKAKNILETIETSGVDENDRVFIMTLILNKAISNEFIPSEASFLELRNIYNNGGLFANVAGVFLTEYHHFNETGFIHTKQAILSSSDQVIKIDESLFHVYPNPGEDNIFIDYSIENTKDASLNIYSVNGTFLLKIELNSEFGRQSIDIQSLASGIYIIGLNVDQEIVEYVKFVKK